jgi:hypothetical protein
VTVDEAKALLESQGYVVLRAKSYQQARTRHAITVAEVLAADRQAESARQWAIRHIDEERRLAARCEFLYGEATRLGATAEQLAHAPSTEDR